MNHILVFGFGHIYEPSIKRALSAIGYHIDSMNGTITNYDIDLSVTQAFQKYLELCRQHHFSCKAVFTVNYLPFLSDLCEHNHLPYISWLVDCPLNTVFSKSILNPCNYIFSFDEVQLRELKLLGVKNSYHLPLGTDVKKWDEVFVTGEDQQKYGCDISFLGNLYNDPQSNIYQTIDCFPAYVKGYLEGIIHAQSKIYGYNFIEEVLTGEIIALCKKHVPLSLGPAYFDVYRTILRDLLNKHISMTERIAALNQLGQHLKLDLYTSSDASELTAPKIRKNGYVSYDEIMPKIFKTSKINLNITSKSITSGIPLRALDILGAGGFLLSNYQPELALHFENGADLVMYESIEDLRQKTAYYLTHNEERNRIARSGYEKIKQFFTLEQKLKELFSLVFP